MRGNEVENVTHGVSVESQASDEGRTGFYETVEMVREWLAWQGRLQNDSFTVGDIADFHQEMTRKHVFWRAGEPDCPRDIKAGNGELHTLRCKVCGLDRPRDPCVRFRNARAASSTNKS